MMAKKYLSIWFSVVLLGSIIRDMLIFGKSQMPNVEVTSHHPLSPWILGD